MTLLRSALIKCQGIKAHIDGWYSEECDDDVTHINLGLDQTFERTRSNGQGFNGHLDVDGVDQQDLAACIASDKQIALRINQQIGEASKAGVSATPTLLVRDNMTGRSIKLEGPADGVLLLSAIDWLAQKADARQELIKFDQPR